MNKIFAVALLAYAWVVPAYACLVLPQNLAQEHAQLVDQAKSIALAEVVAFGRGVYRFRVITNLKGISGTEIFLQGSDGFAGHWETTFNDHTDERFWVHRSGRLGIKGDCTLTLPTFMIGARYLLLLDGPADTKIYEKISDPEDLWLKFVERQVKKD